MGASASEPAIETVGLTKRFGSFTALDGLSIRVEPGEVYGFLGPNGAGKTTTIRMLLGLSHPTAGSARIFGLDARTQAVEAHRRLAFVPGEVDAWPTLPGGEILDLLGSLHGGADPAFRAELVERFAFDPSKRGREYSKGNRQKVALIAAFMVQPDLLVLDEPTSGLDPLMEVVFRECVEAARARGQTVFLSSHILSEVEATCDRVAILRAGRLVEVGTLDDLRRLDTKEVHVGFSTAPPVGLAEVTGVEGMSVEPVPGSSDGGTTVTFHLRGSPAPMLAALAAAGAAVASVSIREPSLEELFLRFYGAEDREGAADAGP